MQPSKREYLTRVAGQRSLRRCKGTYPIKCISPSGGPRVPNIRHLMVLFLLRVWRPTQINLLYVSQLALSPAVDCGNCMLLDVAPVALDAGEPLGKK